MINRIKNTIQSFPNWPIVQDILKWSKRVSIPGFSGVPIYNVLVFIFHECMRDAISTRANSVAFNFVLAIFPGIIFIFTLVPLLPYSDFYSETIFTTLRGALPLEASDYLIGIIEGITEIKRGGLLSLGFFLAAFFASNGMLNLMFGFDKSYNRTFKTRSYFKLRLVAAILTFLLFITFLVSVVFIVVGDRLIDLFLEYVDAVEGSFLFSGFRWLLAIGLIYTSIMIIYRYGPSMHRKTGFWSPGAILATTLSLATSFGFAFFINNFSKYNEIYGSIGALIIIMIWLQLNAYILLIGFELNASIAVNRDLLEEKSD